jgi:hypothetical protein
VWHQQAHVAHDTLTLRSQLDVLSSLVMTFASNLNGGTFI